MLELFINGKKADINQDERILIEKTLTQYVNPTIIKNSFTKTVTLPGTKNNELIFSNIFNSQYVVSNGSFNPSKRTPFKLFNNDKLVESGYIKLNAIKENGKTRKYETTLYGELGNILYGLSYDKDGNKLTLGALTYDYDLTFNVRRNEISKAWAALTILDAQNSKYDTFNFIVSYNGVPDVEGFDPKKCLMDLSSSYIKGWTCNGKSIDNLPTALNDNGDPDPEGTYKPINEGSTTLPVLGLVELDREATDLELRDFRSYMLRPVLRISKLMKAIAKYVKDNFNYTVSFVGDMFETTDYDKRLWMTLDMLYEIDKTVKSGDYFTQQKLLSLTDTPASYLISFCKTYGLYIDVDVESNIMTIYDRKNFYNAGSESITVDELEEKSTTPLSFDKAAYEFSFAESESGVASAYNDTYGVQYGIKKVNTGFEFDASTSKYIENNIFKEGVDVMQTSPFYRNFNKPTPFSVPDVLRELQFSLFKYTDIDKKYNVVTAPLSSDNALTNSGYYITHKNWGGVRNGVSYDAFPKLDCTNDGKPAKSGNILVWFNGMIRPATTVAPYSERIPSEATDIDKTAIQVTIPNSDLIDYKLTDDIYQEWLNGERCWLCTNYQDTTVSITVQSLPSFSRTKYAFNYDPSILRAQMRDLQYWTAVGGLFTPNTSFNNGVTFTGNGTADGYIWQNINIQKDHIYFCLGLYRCDFSQNGTNYPFISDCTLIDKKNFVNSDVHYTVCGSIGKANATMQSQVRSFAVNKNLWKADIIMICVYDLTALGLENLTKTDDAISYFGYHKGSSFRAISILDFGLSRENYVPTLKTNGTTDIYSTYWKTYIEDLYSVDTRIMKCRIRTDNIRTVFRKFVWYNGTNWVLNKISDYDIDSGFCNAEFIKVNRKTSYTN